MALCLWMSLEQLYYFARFLMTGISNQQHSYQQFKVHDRKSDIVSEANNTVIAREMDTTPFSIRPYLLFQRLCIGLISLKRTHSEFLEHTCELI